MEFDMQTPQTRRTGQLPRPPSPLFSHLAAVGLAAAAVVCWAVETRADEPADKTLYVVAVSHLDTQWWWTIQETIESCIPATFAQTFEQFEKYPDYHFSWEGAFRYMLLREYYPTMYEKLKGYVADGRWSPAGSTMEGGDVNIPSPESLVRQFLYGNSFFEKEFGKTSVDVFLPDCFGFGYALPSVAAHCGIKGFSTQKLTWGSAIELPFSIGNWEGPDGNSLIAVLKPGSYIGTIDHDLSHDEELLAKCEAQFDDSGQRLGYHYFGTGDQGGAAPEKSVEWLQKSIEGDGPVHVVSTSSDQLYRDLTPEQVDSLPGYKGELLLTTHGSGAYTSEAAMKRFNRKNELLGDAAERASVAADWLGGAPYPLEKLTDAWIRFIIKQFHDDLTGTGIPEIYVFSWNDEVIALNRFASALTDAVGAVARALDTEAEGRPLVVFNPLSADREDIVEATVRYPGEPPAAVRVYGPDGTEVPSQVTAVHDDSLEVVFLAKVPAVGFAMFDVRKSDESCSLDTGVSITENSLENEQYRVEIDENGDVSSVHDKVAARDLLAGAARLALFDDNSAVWPGWEIIWSDVEAGPRDHVGGPAQAKVVEAGPARVTLEITRTAADSTYVQRIRLAAGSGGERVEFDTEIEWKSLATFLKAEFPLAVSSEHATYDLGLGTISRGNNTPKLYEVPAQQWADITAADGEYGVSILNDCKYGWDKPEDDTLRLTLLHTPIALPIAIFYGHDVQDIGPHRLLYALYGHKGDWRNGSAWHAARLNQPLLAFQTASHPGELGKEFSFVAVSRAEVMVKALKKAEEGDEYVVRVQELNGQPVSDAHLSLGTGLASAREVNGSEQEVGPAAVVDGELVFDMGPYQVRTFAVVPSESPLDLPPPESYPASLPFDADVASPDSDRADGAFGKAFDGPVCSYAAELFPGKLTNDGIRYEMGGVGPGEANAVACRGQAIPIPGTGIDRAYVLAAAEGEENGRFAIGELSVEIMVQDFSGWIGQWVSRVADGKRLTEIDTFLPAFVKLDSVAWYGTHRHRKSGDGPYMFTYIYRYVLPVPPGADELVLPDNPAIRVFAVSFAGNTNSDTTAAGILYDGFEPTHEPIYWSLYEPQPENPDGSETLPDGMPDSVAGPNPDSGSGTAGESGGSCSAGTGGGGRAAGLWLLLFGLALLAFSRLSGRNAQDPRSNSHHLQPV